MFHGRAEVNLQTTDAVVSEALLLEILEDGRLGAVTHAYNGTLSLDQEARMLFVRSVVVTVKSVHRLGCSWKKKFHRKTDCLKYIM